MVEYVRRASCVVRARLCPLICLSHYLKQVEHYLCTSIMYKYSTVQHYVVRILVRFKNPGKAKGIPFPLSLW